MPRTPRPGAGSRRRRALPAGLRRRRRRRADGASGVQPPACGGISAPPSQGRADEALRPACPSCSATGTGGACRRARARRSPSAFPVASSHSPRHPGVIRPSAVTAVASMQNMPAPDCSSWPQCTRCQSVACPSAAEYWHIGDTTIRLRSVTPRSASGSNRWAGFSPAFLIDPHLEADRLRRRDVGFPRPAIREGERRRPGPFGAKAEGGEPARAGLPPLGRARHVRGLADLHELRRRRARGSSESPSSGCRRG